MILDQATQDANRLREWSSPLPPQQQSFSVLSAIGAGAKGLPAAGLEVAGHWADVFDAMGQAAEAGAVRLLPQPEGKYQAESFDAYRRSKGVSIGTPEGSYLRAKAEEFGPDPATAHTADQVVHGVVKGLGKLGGYIYTMGGVPGALAFGADEGNTTAQRLIEKGVDTGTAAKVGAVTGVANAAGALIPVAGSTIKATVGLALASGPGTYMAQEAATRKILADASYADEASLHNPFDPLGLGLSILLPGLAGGFHLRAMAARQKSLADVVQHIESGGQRFGPDGQLLTSPKGAQGEMQVMPKTATDPGFGVTPARDNSPEELARVGRDYLAAMVKRYPEDTDKALAAYNAGPGAVDAAVKAHGADWLAHLPQETREYIAKAHKLGSDHVTAEAAADPRTVDAARVKVAEDRLTETLPDMPSARAELARAADAIGAGERPVLMTPAPWDLPRTLDDAPQAHQAADELRAMAQGAYWAQEGGRLIRTGVDEAGDGGMGGAVSGRTPWVAADEWFGRMRSQLGRDGLSSQQDIAAAVEKAIRGDKLLAAERRTIDWMRVEVDEMRQQAMRHGFDDGTAGMLAGDGLAHGLGKQDAEDLALTARAAMLDESAVERAAMQHESDDAAFMDEIRRIIADHGQEATPAADKPGASSGTRGPGDGAAPRGANALPSPEEVGAPAPTAATAEAGGLPAFDRSAFDSLAEQSPDMRVTLPGHDQPMRLADAMEFVKEQAQAIKRDAELVRAAVACALENGVTA